MLLPRPKIQWDKVASRTMKFEDVEPSSSEYIFKREKTL